MFTRYFADTYFPGRYFPPLEDAQQGVDELRRPRGGIRRPGQELRVGDPLIEQEQIAARELAAMLDEEDALIAIALLLAA
jgi:hypothetical protein